VTSSSVVELEHELVGRQAGCDYGQIDRRLRRRLRDTPRRQRPLNRRRGGLARRRGGGAGLRVVASSRRRGLAPPLGLGLAPAPPRVLIVERTVAQAELEGAKYGVAEQLLPQRPLAMLVMLDAGRQDLPEGALCLLQQIPHVVVEAPRAAAPRQHRRHARQQDVLAACEPYHRGLRLGEDGEAESGELILPLQLGQAQELRVGPRERVEVPSQPRIAHHFGGKVPPAGICHGPRLFSDHRCLSNYPSLLRVKTLCVYRK